MPTPQQNEAIASYRPTFATIVRLPRTRSGSVFGERIKVSISDADEKGMCLHLTYQPKTKNGKCISVSSTLTLGDIQDVDKFNDAITDLANRLLEVLEARLSL